MSQEDDAVVAWIRESAFPLATLNPHAPLDDLAPFQRIVGDAAIVGLGEGSHGTRECFLAKHRLLRFLVEKMGFTLVAMEMDWMRAAALNDYILTGRGDARTLLKQNGYWFWYAEEILDLSEWLRAYNADPHHQRIYFAGFDAVGLERASLDQVVRYIERVDPPHAARVAALYQPLSGVSILRSPAADRSGAAGFTVAGRASSCLHRPQFSSRLRRDCSAGPHCRASHPPAARCGCSPALRRIPGDGPAARAGPGRAYYLAP